MSHLIVSSRMSFLFLHEATVLSYATQVVSNAKMIHGLTHISGL